MNPAANPSARAMVVGAGVIGLACAGALQNAGFEVCVADRGEPGREASFGNAGGIAVSEVLPLASPGLAWKIPRWLIDPLGPLALRPGHLPALAPWLWRFWRSAHPGAVQSAGRALAALLEHALRDTARLLDDLGAATLLQQEGALALYEHESTWRGERAQWRARARLGVAFEEVPAQEIARLEPDLAPIFARGVRVPAWAHVSDPFEVVRALAGRCARRGGRLLRAEVNGFESTDDKVSAVRTSDGSRHPVDLVVIAAGAWSGRLCAALGERVLLTSERGYHLTLPRPGVRLRGMVLSAERSFVMTPMAMGLRLAGTAEFAGLEAPADFRRAEALAHHARRFFPELDTDGASRWMGQRPATPDSLPVIGRSARHRNVIHAFGHGHLGLTLAATTARLVGALARGERPALDLAPYAIARFS